MMNFGSYILRYVIFQLQSFLNVSFGLLLCTDKSIIASNAIQMLKFPLQVTFCKRGDSLYQQEWMHGHCELLSHMVWAQPYKHFNTEYPHPVISPMVNYTEEKKIKNFVHYPP